MQFYLLIILAFLTSGINSASQDDAPKEATRKSAFKYMPLEALRLSGDFLTSDQRALAAGTSKKFRSAFRTLQVSSMLPLFTETPHGLSGIIVPSRIIPNSAGFCFNEMTDSGCIGGAFTLEPNSRQAIGEFFERDKNPLVFLRGGKLEAHFQWTNLYRHYATKDVIDGLHLTDAMANGGITFFAGYRYPEESLIVKTSDGLELSFNDKNFRASILCTYKDNGVVVLYVSHGDRNSYIALVTRNEGELKVTKATLPAGSLAITHTNGRTVHASAAADPSGKFICATSPSGTFNFFRVFADRLERADIDVTSRANLVAFDGNGDLWSATGLTSYDRSVECYKVNLTDEVPILNKVGGLRLMEGGCTAIAGLAEGGIAVAHGVYGYRCSAYSLVKIINCNSSRKVPE